MDKNLGRGPKIWTGKKNWAEGDVLNRVKMNIPPFRFGISPDDDVNASKRK